VERQVLGLAVDWFIGLEERPVGELVAVAGGVADPGEGGMPVAGLRVDVAAELLRERTRRAAANVAGVQVIKPLVQEPRRERVAQRRQRVGVTDVAVDAL
jgi:hypothetical protein